MNTLLDEIGLRFVSGNSVPVERATMTRAEYDQLRALLSAQEDGDDAEDAVGRNEGHAPNYMTAAQWIDASPDKNRVISITNHVSANADLLQLPERYSEYGELEGALGQVTAHGDDFGFRIYDPVTDKSVTCEFDPSELALVADSLQQRIRVSGKVTYRRKDHAPLSVRVDDWSPLTPLELIPDIEEIHAMRIDAARGIPSEEVIKALRRVNLVPAEIGGEMSDELVQRLRAAANLKMRHEDDRIGLTKEAIKEIERLRSCLRYEEHRFATQSTHSDDCHTLGPRHYECAMQEIERLRAEVAALKEAAEPRILSMQVRDGGLDMELHGTACRALAESFAEEFQKGGGVNYIECRFTSRESMPDESFVVTVQRTEGKTPHQLRHEAESALAALRKRVEESDTWTYKGKRVALVVLGEG